jgi:UDP-glucose 4-epimerase
VTCETALGERPYLEVFGTDYPTPDGTCIRDYIHVSDLVRAHLDALRYLRAGGKSEVLNCGYGSGFSVLDVIGSVKQASQRDFPVRMGPRRAGDPAAIVAKAERISEVLGWKPRLNDLDTIVGHALAWEKRLIECRAAS